MADNHDIDGYRFAVNKKKTPLHDVYDGIKSFVEDERGGKEEVGRWMISGGKKKRRAC